MVMEQRPSVPGASVSCWLQRRVRRCWLPQKHGWTHGHADTQPQPRTAGLLQDHSAVFGPSTSPSSELAKSHGELNQPGVLLAPRLRSCSAACWEEPENETTGFSLLPSSCVCARPHTCCRQPKAKLNMCICLLSPQLLGQIWPPHDGSKGFLPVMGILCCSGRAMAQPPLGKRPPWQC